VERLKAKMEPLITAVTVAYKNPSLPTGPSDHSRALRVGLPKLPRGGGHSSLCWTAERPSSLLGPVIHSFRAFSGRFTTTVRRYEFKKGFQRKDFRFDYLALLCTARMLYYYLHITCCVVNFIARKFQMDTFFLQDYLSCLRCEHDPAGSKRVCCRAKSAQIRQPGQDSCPSFG